MTESILNNCLFKLNNLISKDKSELTNSKWKGDYENS